MICAVIIDDEQNNIDSLQSLLAQFCPDITVAGTALNSKQGIACIKQHDPHLVFLDIEIPYGNAFDMLEKIMPVDFEVIFVTAFEQYAVKAIKYVALDYLLKPVSIEELKTAVKRARKRIEEKKINTRIELLLSNLKTEPGKPLRIGLPTTEGFLFEDTGNILYMESERNLTIVHTTQRQLTTSKTLKEFESLLPVAFFCRIHHASIININFVKKYNKGRGGSVELTNGIILEVSVRKKEDLLERLGIANT